MQKMLLSLISVLGLWLVMASQAGALTNGSVTIEWTKTTDATIRYELRWKHFANGWLWAPIAGNLDSTTGSYVFTFPPLADSTGDRGFCVDARAVRGTAVSAWVSDGVGPACAQMPLTTAVPVPTPVPIPTPVPPPSPSGLVIASATPDTVVITARAADCVRVVTSTLGSTSTSMKRTVRCVKAP